jgi:hypothetical protein
MAKQAGDIFIEGTIDDLSFYKMDGKYYVRMKSSLTGKKFWKHKAFEGSRKSAELLGRASKIASSFYRSYPKEKKHKGLFNEIVGKAKLWFKDGKDEEEVMLLLQGFYPVMTISSKRKKKISAKKSIVSRWQHKGLFVIPHYEYKKKKPFLFFMKE